MAELKTKKTTASVDTFLSRIEPEQKREDCQKLRELFTKVTGEQAVMWGESIVGFGQYHYKSERSAQEGDWPLTAFSPRKANITLYIMSGFSEYRDLLKKLGKHKTSTGSCIYITKLEHINLEVLSEIISHSVRYMKEKYATFLA